MYSTVLSTEGKLKVGFEAEDTVLYHESRFESTVRCNASFISCIVPSKRTAIEIYHIIFSRDSCQLLWTQSRPLLLFRRRPHV